MRNECLRLIGHRQKPRHCQEIHVVMEVVDGRVIETRLPKESAERLYRKLRAAGTEVNIRDEQVMTTIMACEQLRKKVDILVNDLGIKKFGILLSKRVVLIIKYIRTTLGKSNA